jgi:hypothetical protein
MLRKIVQTITGRKYSIEASDIPYAAQKGLLPTIRGTVWSLRRLRHSHGFMLGPYTQFLSASKLHVGRGVSIGGFGYFDCSAKHGVKLADRVTIREFAWVQGRSGLNEPAEGLVVGAGSYIGPYAKIGIGGTVVIGDDVQIGARLSITAESHLPGPDGSYVTGRVSRKGVRIGDRCWIGDDVTIIDGVEIGARSVVGAGSVVTRNIPPNSVAFGVPARPRENKATARSTSE